MPEDAQKQLTDELQKLKDLVAAAEPDADAIKDATSAVQQQSLKTFEHAYKDQQAAQQQQQSSPDGEAKQGDAKQEVDAEYEEVKKN